jgi:hypothetical protein
MCAIRSDDMKLLTAAGLMLGLATSAVTGQIQSGDDPSAAGRAHVPTTLTYLNERLAEVDFQDAELDQVMDWIASLTPLNIVVHWQVLEDAGIERDKPITIHVRNLRLSQVLWMIMDEAGGPDLKLAYRASGELLILSTEEDLRREMVIRVYDVSDLLVSIPRFTGPRPSLMAASGGELGSPRSGAQSEGEEARPDQRHDTEIQKLIDLIVETVEPDSWVVHGGLGTIRAFHEVLVVRNSIRVHQALGGRMEEND